MSEKSSDNEIRLSEEISLIQKKLEKEILKSDIEISIFEFREVAERYIGLTFAKQNAESITFSKNNESELFTFSENANPGLSSICLNRRNRNRLLFHHKNARQDFLDILSLGNDEKNLGFLAFDFATLLNDEEAQNALIEMFNEVGQIGKNQTVKDSEKDLWKTEKHKQFPAKQLSIRLQTLIATANLRRKD